MNDETIDNFSLIELIVQQWHLFPVNDATELLRVIEEALQHLPQRENATILQQQLKQKKDSIKETFYGSTKIWAVRAKANEKQKHCRFCNDCFRKNAEQAAVSCEYCRNEVNQHHNKEAVPVTKYGTVSIGPCCTRKKEWQITAEEVARQQLKPIKIIDRTKGENGDIEGGDTYFVVIPLQVTNQIFIEESFVHERILILKTSIAKKTVNDYPKLLHEYLYLIPTNCQYVQVPGGLDVARGQKYFFDHVGPKFGSKFTRDTLGYEAPIKPVDFWVSHFGPGRFNAFFGFGRVLEDVGGGVERCQFMKDVICSDLLTLSKDPRQLQLFQEKCQAAMEGNGMRGFSVNEAYKGWKPCQQGLLNDDEEMVLQFLEKKGKEDNNLELYFEKDKIDKLHEYVKEILDLEHRLSSSFLTQSQRKKKRKKVQKLRRKKEKLVQNYFKKKKSKIKVVPSTAKEYISRTSRGKEFLREIDRFKCLICILQLAIALQFPQLSKPLLQYIITKNKIDGSEYGATDIMIYDEGYYVFPHIDTEGVIVEDMLSHGCYVVAKIDPEATSSIFCNCSEAGGGKNANCCWRDEDPESVNYGGHQELCPMCIYFMVRKGAHGGPYHCLHGKKRKGVRNLWCGFDSRQITMVFRPMI